MKTLATIIGILTVSALTACSSVAAAPAAPGAPPAAASAQQPAAAGGDQQGAQGRRQGGQAGGGQGRQANGGGGGGFSGQAGPGGGRANRQGGADTSGGQSGDQGQTQGQVPGGAFGGNRVDGVVTKVDGDAVTLASGATFKLDPQARVTRTIKKTADDLKPGQFVAITGSGQPDSSILATQIAILGDSLRAQNAGQRQLPTGDLMTNATIDSINGYVLQVTFPGGKARIVLVANVEVLTREVGAAADIRPGATVATSVPADGVARVVNVQ